MKRLALWIGLGILSQSAPVFSKGTLLNGAAASLNHKVVTVQDAFVYRAIQRVRAGQEPVILEEQGEDLKKTIQKVVFEEMVLQESKGAQDGGRSQSESDRLMKEKPKALETICQRYGLTMAELAQRVLRSLKAERYLQLKIEILTPVITEDEGQKYFRRNETSFPGKTYSEVKLEIVSLLKKQAVQKSLEEWIRSLKEKYEVSMLLDNGLK